MTSPPTIGADDNKTKSGGFNFGYQLLITNPAQAAFVQFVNDSYAELHGVRQDKENLEFIWGVIVSTFFWGATVAALLIQITADYFGRKNGIIVTFVAQIIAVLVDNYIMYSVAPDRARCCNQCLDRNCTDVHY
ncbi:hypothetical protein COOONC_06818 [Cooperia oncophora]